MKNVLCLLHLPPPNYGVTIFNQQVIRGALSKEYRLDTLSINTAKKLNSVGIFAFTKIFVFFALFFKLLIRLIVKRFCFCYFSLTPTGLGFKKDLFFVFLLKIFRVKTIYHLHGKGISKHSSLIDKALYKFCFNGSKVIIPSKLFINELTDYMEVKDISILPNAIKPNLNQSDYEKIIEQRSNNNRIGLLFLANMIKSKGVFIALEAAYLLKQKGIEFSLSFVGGWGDMNASEFRKKVSEYGLDNVVQYLGFKSGPEKLKVLTRADIFIYPTYHDLFSLVILEAMEFGLPIITTDEGALAEVVEDQKCGLIIAKKDPEKLAQAIERLVDDPSLRLKFGEEARKRFLDRYRFELLEKSLIEILKIE